MGHEQAIVELFKEGLWLTLFCLLIIVLPGLVLSLIVSVLQAATQITESSLSFIPKLIATLVTLIMAGPWLIERLVQHTQTWVQAWSQWLG